MSNLTREQMKEVAQVINQYAKPATKEDIAKQEKQRQKLIAFLKGDNRSVDVFEAD